MSGQRHLVRPTAEPEARGRRRGAHGTGSASAGAAPAAAIGPVATGSAARGHVGLQAVEQRAERGHLGDGQPGAQPLVEGDDAMAEALELGLPGRGQLHPLDPPVVRVPMPAHQPGGLHAGEVVRQRGALDAERLGQLPLRTGHPGLERDQHQPHRQRAADLGQGVVEGAADELGGAGEAEADRLGQWTSHAQSIDIEWLDVYLLPCKRPRPTDGWPPDEFAAVRGVVPACSSRAVRPSWWSRPTAWR